MFGPGGADRGLTPRLEDEGALNRPRDLVMPSRQVRKHMQAIAIERVLEKRDTRAGISSFAALREAAQSELITNEAEIEACANALVARFRQIDADFLARKLRCASCDGPIQDPKRISRRYCSARCRQRARRTLAPQPAQPRWFPAGTIGGPVGWSDRSTPLWSHLAPVEDQVSDLSDNPPARRARPVERLDLGHERLPSSAAK